MCSRLPEITYLCPGDVVSFSSALKACAMAQQPHMAVLAMTQLESAAMESASWHVMTEDHLDPNWLWTSPCRKIREIGWFYRTSRLIEWDSICNPDLCIIFYLAKSSESPQSISHWMGTGNITPGLRSVRWSSMRRSVASHDLGTGSGTWDKKQTQKFGIETLHVCKCMHFVDA